MLVRICNLSQTVEEFVTEQTLDTDSELVVRSDKSIPTHRVVSLKPVQLTPTVTGLTGSLSVASCEGAKVVSGN